MQLKAVVLPDPLGPMSAVMLRAATSNEQPSSALTPPKDLLISRTDRDLSVVGARLSTAPLIAGSRWRWAPAQRAPAAHAGAAGWSTSCRSSRSARPA